MVVCDFTLGTNGTAVTGESVPWQVVMRQCLMVNVDLDFNRDRRSVCGREMPHSRQYMMYSVYKVSFLHIYVRF